MRKKRSANKSPHVGRDYLRPHEANALIEAAGRVGRQRLRDEVLLRLMYHRHGLRASEAKHTKWTDFDLTPGSGSKTFHVRRLKGSIDSLHTLDRDEVSALRKLKATSTSPFVFVSERGGALSPDMIARIVERAAEAAKLGFHVHPHMLRHATGYALANEGTDTRLIQDFLGQASIANTVRYTRPHRVAWQRCGCDRVARRTHYSKSECASPAGPISGLHLPIYSWRQRRPPAHLGDIACATLPPIDHSRAMLLNASSPYR
jgi:type 1 fimbriae regulatory protein FimB/type 1 fimbriae regulatory protein FimE